MKRLSRLWRRVSGHSKDASEKAPRKSVGPDVVAAVSFKVTQNKNGMDAVLASVSKENQDRVALELELLSAFCRSYAIQICFPDEDLRHAINKEFSKFFPSQSESYFGRSFEDILPMIKDRFERYHNAVNEHHEQGPVWSVGKVFAELCGLKNCSVTAYRGGLWFTKEFEVAKEGFDKIIKDYDLAKKVDNGISEAPSCLSHFHDIVSEYGRVLGENSHMVFGVPRSKLPYSLPDIKEAIIKVALDGLDEPEFIEQLRTGYMMLATFIEDEEALRYEKARLAMATVMGKSPMEKCELARATEEFAAAGKAQEAMLQGMQDNKVVFNEVVGKLKVRIN